MHFLNGILLGEFAIKKVPVGDHQEWLVRMLREVTLLEQLRHPNIIEYKHCWVEDHSQSAFSPAVPTLFILMEQANAGNLQEYIEPQLTPSNHRRPQPLSGTYPNQASISGGLGYSPCLTHRVRYLTKPQILSLFTDICRGLSHLHAAGIVHRDLKPSNLLLHYDASKPDGLPTVLISDFGECAVLGTASESGTGTTEFMAPELLRQKRTAHSTSHDIWSLGIILYYLSYSRVPYSQIEDVDLLKDEICAWSGVIFEDDDGDGGRVGDDVKRLITGLLDEIPERRPRVQDVLGILEGVEL